MIRDENGMLAGYVYVDVARPRPRQLRRRREAARSREQLQLPAGYSLAWSGQYEAMERVRERLNVVVPLTLFLIFILLYLNTRRLAKTLIVLLAVPVLRGRRGLAALRCSATTCPSASGSA